MLRVGLYRVNQVPLVADTIFGINNYEKKRSVWRSPRYVCWTQSWNHMVTAKGRGLNISIFLQTHNKGLEIWQKFIVFKCNMLLPCTASHIIHILSSTTDYQSSVAVLLFLVPLLTCPQQKCIYRVGQTTGLFLTSSQWSKFIT